MKRALSRAPKLKYILYLDVWDVLDIMCTKFICRISIMQGHVSFSLSCENFAYLQVVSVKMTFQQINSTCGNCTYANFQKNIFACWNYLDSPSLSKFQSTESVWILGHSRIPHCRNLLKLGITGLKLCENHTYS